LRLEGSSEKSRARLPNRRPPSVRSDDGSTKHEMQLLAEEPANSQT
jgi:hypothetical protein